MKIAESAVKRYPLGVLPTHTHILLSGTRLYAHFNGLFTEWVIIIVTGSSFEVIK